MRKTVDAGARRVGADRIIGRSRSDGSTAGDIRETVNTARQSATLGAKVGGGAGALVGALAGTAVGVAKNRRALVILAVVILSSALLVAAPIIAVPYFLASRSSTADAATDTTAAQAAETSGIPPDAIAGYRQIADANPGIPWEILAAIEHDNTGDKTSAQTATTPAGPYGLIVDRANAIAKRGNFATITTHTVLDRSTAGAALASAFNTVADPRLHSLPLDSGAIVDTSSASSRRIIPPSTTDPAHAVQAGRAQALYVAAIKALPIGKAQADAERIFANARHVALGHPLANCDPSATGTGAEPEHETDWAGQSTMLNPSGNLPSNGSWIDPLKGSVASVYGWRTHPVTGERSFHSGEDVAAASRTPIHAAAAGVVTHTGWVDRWYGNEVAIDHGGGVTTHYRHLWDDTMYVKTGQRVKAGQVIAGVGSTGTSTGPHLHLEVHVDGKPVNPTQFLAARDVTLGRSTTGADGNEPRKPGSTAPPADSGTPAASGDPDGTGQEPVRQPLTAHDANGGTVTLTPKQLGYASILLGVGDALHAPDGVKQAALITALQESMLHIYANSAVPESLSIPHDSVGSDHDSVGLFQQRPPTWGGVKELMDPTYSARMFYGGPSKPKKNGPPGVLDLPDADTGAPGRLAQEIQVSATPDAYDTWIPVADAIMKTVSGTATAINTTGVATGCGTVSAAGAQDPGPGPWGGHRAGHIPTSDTCRVAKQWVDPTVFPGYRPRLRCDAATALGQLAAAAKDATGTTPKMQIGYASEQDWQACRAAAGSSPRGKPHTWALSKALGKPGDWCTGQGSSMYLWALAVRFDDTGRDGHTVTTWLATHAASHGWQQPGWASAGGSRPEPGYFEYGAASAQGDPNPDGTVAAIIKAARSQLGTPYQFGGGGIDGCPCDCSSLMQYAFWQGAKIKLPRLTYDQITSPLGQKIPRSRARAGDMIFFQIPGESGWGHVGLLLSEHTMIHDPHTGDVVKISDVHDRYYAHLPQQVIRVKGAG